MTPSGWLGRMNNPLWGGGALEERVTSPWGISFPLRGLSRVPGRVAPSPGLKNLGMTWGEGRECSLGERAIPLDVHISGSQTGEQGTARGDSTALAASGGEASTLGAPGAPGWSRTPYKTHLWELKPGHVLLQFRCFLSCRAGDGQGTEQPEAREGSPWPSFQLREFYPTLGRMTTRGGMEETTPVPLLEHTFFHRLFIPFRYVFIGMFYI